MPSGLLSLSSPNPLRSSSVGQRKNRARLTTPSRPQYGLSTPFQPSSAAPATPFEIRWPLISFLRRAGYDEATVRLASQAPDPFVHQILLVHVEDLEEHFAAVKHLRARITCSVEGPDTELDALSELRTQFFRSALRTVDAQRTKLSATTESLRQCILNSLGNVRRQLEDLVDKGFVKDSVPALADSTHAVVRETGPPFGGLVRSPTFGGEIILRAPESEVVGYDGGLGLMSSCTPVKPPRARTTFIGGTPSRHCTATPQSSRGSSSLMDGDTPLDKVKEKAIRFQRVKALKKIVVGRAEEGRPLRTPVKLAVQDSLARLTKGDKRLSVISEEEDEKPMSRKRRANECTDDEEDDNVRQSTAKRKKIDDHRQSVATTTTTSSSVNHRYSQDTAASGGERTRDSEITPISTEDEVKQKKSNKADVKVRKSIAAGTLLGTKVAPTNRKKYVSRVAMNAKTKRTRERKSVREALHASNGGQYECADGSTVEEPIVKNKSRRTRKADAIKTFQEQKFVTKAKMSMRDIIDSYRVEDVGVEGESNTTAEEEDDSSSTPETSWLSMETARGSRCPPTQRPSEHHFVSPLTHEVSSGIEEDIEPGPTVPTDRLLQQLRTIFGLERFRVGQLEAIQHLLATETPQSHFPSLHIPIPPSVVPALLVSLPTGGGKSLIYQMAGYNLAKYNNELTIVVCPTIPLLDDQVNKMPTKRNGKRIINISKLHGSVDYDEVRRLTFGLSQGLIDVLFTTPEQLITDRLQYYLKSGRQVGLMCIDEAHCLSEWGHSFRPAYQRIVKMAIRRLRVRRLLLTTATASQSTLKSITRIIDEDGQIDLKIVRYGSDTSLQQKSSTEVSPSTASIVIRPDLQKTVSMVGAAPGELNLGSTRGLESLLSVLRTPDWKNSKGVILIYTWMKWIAERTCQRIKEEFPNEVSLYYHSGMDGEEKQRVTASLMNGKCRYLVATQALGIGVDSPYVVRVAHLNIPSTLEQYIQEIGRCNRTRALTTANCHVVMDNNDYRLRYQQISSSAIDRVAVCNSLRQLLLSDLAPPTGLKGTKRGRRGQDAETAEAESIFLDLMSVSSNTGTSKNVTNVSAPSSDRGICSSGGDPVLLTKAIRQMHSDRRVLYTSTAPEAVTLPVIYGKMVIKYDRLVPSAPQASPCVAPTPSRTPRTAGTAPPISWSSESKASTFEMRMIMVTVAELGRMFNVRSEDELQVIMTMLQSLSENSAHVELCSNRQNGPYDDAGDTSGRYSSQKESRRRIKKADTISLVDDPYINGLAEEWAVVSMWWRRRLNIDLSLSTERSAVVEEEKEVAKEDASQSKIDDNLLTPSQPVEDEVGYETDRGSQTSDGLNSVHAAVTVLGGSEVASPDAICPELLSDKGVDVDDDGSLVVVSEGTGGLSSEEAGTCIVEPSSSEGCPSEAPLPGAEAAEERCRMEKLQRAAELRGVAAEWRESTELFHIYNVNSEGVEIRCFGEALEEIIEKNPLVRFLSKYWQKSSSGVYRIYWYDMMATRHDAIATLYGSLVINVDLVDQMLRDISGDLHISVKPITTNNVKYVYMRLLQTERYANVLTKYLKGIVDTVVSTMERNNRVQLNRLDALMTAMLIRHQSTSEREMDGFIEDYFVNDEVDESSNREKIWSHYKERYQIDPAKLLDENNFHKKLGAVEVARLRFDIEQLVKYLRDNGARNTQMVISESCAPLKGDVRIVTPVTIARILTGLTSYQYNQQNSTHLPGWRSYSSTCYTTVRDVCYRTMKSLV